MDAFSNILAKEFSLRPEQVQAVITALSELTCGSATLLIDEEAFRPMEA